MRRGLPVGQRAFGALLLFLSGSLFPAIAAPACPPGDRSFPVFYPDKAVFDAAIAQADKYEPANERLTGITVPHHLVAAHLMARGFRAASGFPVKRVILLSPDHFRQTDTKLFATTTRGFDTVFGPVAADTAAARTLIAAGIAEESCLFTTEHGVGALLPFIHNSFPDAKVLAVAMSIRSGRADWDRLADALLPLLDDDTLIVQSTDFSHYLPQNESRRFDQQTLNVLASGLLDAIAALRQPDHADSVGALYVNTRLQRMRFGAAPLAVANENLQDYSQRFIAETTSYIVLLYGRFGPRFNNPDYGASSIIYFAGDTLFGRAMTRVLSEERAADAIEREVLDRTRGRPLIVNLEGVVLPNVPEALEHMTLGMPEELTAAWLKRLNVAGAGLANNHAFDLGGTGYAETRRALAAAGIPAFGQGEALALPGLTVVGLKDIDSTGSQQTKLMTPEILDRLLDADPAKPVVAFVHWGVEYRADPGPRERMLSGEMRLRGASAVIGAHPHVASGKVEAMAGGDMAEIYSLGNFLFDQAASRSSGAMVEVRTFAQGTVFLRLIPLPNFFEMGGK